RRDLAQPLDLARLRDVPVLTELAAKVAACGAKRQYARARIEVVQRLLLDRVDTKPRAPAVSREHHLVALVLPHKAEPAVPLLEAARPRAQVADDPPALRIVIVVPPAAPDRAVGTQPLGG